MTYSEKLRDPRWQKLRLSVMQAANFQCEACGDDKRELQIHHLCYSKEPWESPPEHLMCLCSVCHKELPMQVAAFLKRTAVLGEGGLSWLLTMGAECSALDREPVTDFLQRLMDTMLLHDATERAFAYGKGCGLKEKKEGQNVCENLRSDI